MDILKALAKASGNEMASIMSDGTISDIKEYYDTGCLLLNAQISGSIFKGTPDCKTICYSGQSQTFKTFLIIENLKNFLNIDKKNHYSVWYASEKAITKNMLKNRGIDVTRVLFVPIGTVEEFNQQIWDILKMIQKIKEKEPNTKYMFILDSLGQLGTRKDQADLDKKEFKENMIRAKHVKKLFRDIELKLAFLRVPMLFTNHVYSTQSFIPIEIVAGGSGVLYSADIILAMRKSKLYQSDKVIGMILTSLSYKNRHAVENSKIKLEILYSTGLSKYSGIFDFCVENKIFKAIKDDTKEEPKSDFEKMKYDSKNKKKQDKKKMYGFAVDENTLVKFNKEMTEKTPEEIFTKPFLKQLDKELAPFFNYGNEYKEEKPKIKPEEDVKKSLEKVVKPIKKVKKEITVDVTNMKPKEAELHMKKTIKKLKKEKSVKKEKKKNKEPEFSFEK